MDVIVTGDRDELAKTWPLCLIEQHDSHRECWRACFHHKGVEFVELVSSRQPLCRDIVRVAKWWAKNHVVEWKTRTEPPSFLLELLVLHALDEDSIQCTSINQGFAKFLQCIINYHALLVT